MRVYVSHKYTGKKEILKMTLRDEIKKLADAGIEPKPGETEKVIKDLPTERRNKVKEAILHIFHYITKK
jgi:hypothetical protein